MNHQPELAFAPFQHSSTLSLLRSDVFDISNENDTHSITGLPQGLDVYQHGDNAEVFTATPVVHQRVA